MRISANSIGFSFPFSTLGKLFFSPSRLRDFEPRLLRSFFSQPWLQLTSHSLTVTTTTTPRSREPFTLNFLPTQSTCLANAPPAPRPRAPPFPRAPQHPPSPSSRPVRLPHTPRPPPRLLASRLLLLPQLTALRPRRRARDCSGRWLALLRMFFPLAPFSLQGRSDDRRNEVAKRLFRH